MATKNDEWKKLNTDTILIRSNKRDQLPARIQQAIDAGKAPSRQAYILNAVREALARDGIPEIKKSSDE